MITKNVMIHPAFILLSALLLLLAAYVVFRRLVRRSYLEHRQLTWVSSSLQLLVFAGLIAFPYMFNPPEWPWFWMLQGPAGPTLRMFGMALILLGFLVAFGTMVWFDLRRAFGFEVKGLVLAGPYRFTRNPQILGGYLLVIGTTLQWPSIYGLVWIVLYGVTGHWMILTEEEHLGAVFGETYRDYCARTPRYLGPPRR